MEDMLIGIIWLIFIFTLLILPFVILCLIGYKRARHKIAVLASFAVLCTEILIAVLLCIQPPIIDLTGHILDEETEMIIRYVSDGRYNTALPVFPTAVVVTENSDGFLRWQTNYGIWGKTEHVYAETYEMTEPLWRW